MLLTHPCVSCGQDGEFPLPFFSRVTDRMCEIAGIGDRSDSVFCDVGSGTGRLVLWAAATQSWRAVLGVELLPSLHQLAIEKREEAVALQAKGALELRTSRISLHEGSWDDCALLPWETVDICFAYTTAFPHDDANVLVDLSKALCDRLRLGSLVCTTDYLLGDGFEVVEQMTGENEGVGGFSVAYIHRKTVDGEDAMVALRARTAELSSRVADLEVEVAERDETIASLEAVVDELRANSTAAGGQSDGQDEDEDETFIESLRRWALDADYEL